MLGPKAGSSTTLVFAMSFESGLAMGWLQHNDLKFMAALFRIHKMGFEFPRFEPTGPLHTYAGAIAVAGYAGGRGPPHQLRQAGPTHARPLSKWINKFNSHACAPFARFHRVDGTGTGGL